MTTLTGDLGMFDRQFGTTRRAGRLPLVHWKGAIMKSFLCVLAYGRKGKDHDSDTDYCMIHSGELSDLDNQYIVQDMKDKYRHVYLATIIQKLK